MTSAITAEDERRPLVIGLGEILWDRFPDGDRLGGAPANVAFHAGQLGARGVPASRIGIDADGERLASELKARGLSLEAVQRDPLRPTGIVRVTLDQGQPSYVIEPDSAWDGLEFTPEWEALAARADAVCFGTLAQRSPTARETIRRFVGGTAPGALRCFDINLRQNFYDLDSVEFGLSHATVLKLNGGELEAVAGLFGWPLSTEAVCQRLFERFPLGWIALTHGAEGCELRSRTETFRSAAPRVECVDAVGAGDAFSAALIVSLLQGRLPQEAADRANRIGAYVAGQAGAMPTLLSSLL